MTARRSSFGDDRGLQARMLVTMLALGLVYAVLVGVLLAVGTGAITVLLIAVAFLSLQFFTSDKIALQTIGTKEVTPTQEPELHAIIDRLCIQANITQARVAVVETQMPNAFAIGSSQKAATVCATTGLLKLLSPGELEAVIGHELTHIINRDVMVMTLASFFASLAAMIIQIGFSSAEATAATMRAIAGQSPGGDCLGTSPRGRSPGAGGRQERAGTGTSGGVMPAERAGSSLGGQRKAIPVEETAVQLGLPIATAENPRGATRRRTRDRLRVLRAAAPKAIGKAGRAAPATMEEVAKRLTDALLKVASNQGAPGLMGRRSRCCLSSGRSCCPGCRPSC